MQLEFKSVILYARQYRTNQNVLKTVKSLLKFLANLKIDVLTDPETASHFKLNLPILAEEGMQNALIIVVGGDGSLLDASLLAIKHQIPVIGINRGRLGFLTDITPQNIESCLGNVLAGKYKKEFRFLLSANIHHDTNNKTFFGRALNDIVLSRGNAPHLIDFEIFVNHQFVSRYHADGMIIATPTGSTAYALSAGGPIMHPQLNAMVIVPMFPHILSSRPLVVDGDVEIEIKINKDNKNPLRLSCDGHQSRIIRPGEAISIKKNKELLCLLHPLDYHYFDTLRVKLGWEVKNHAL